LLRFLIIATTIETDVSMVDEHNVSLELLVGNSLNQAESLNQGWPQESGNVLEDLTRILNPGQRRVFQLVSYNLNYTFSIWHSGLSDAKLSGFRIFLG
jgi:hypothetical protein